MAERKMDKISEAVWFAGREDRRRKGENREAYRDGWDKIFGPRK